MFAGDEGDWNEDDDTVDMRVDKEEDVSVGSDEGDEASSNDDDDDDDDDDDGDDGEDVETFENDEDGDVDDSIDNVNGDEGKVLSGKNMESFESDSDDDGDDDNSDNGDDDDDDDSGESDDGHEEEGEEEVDEEIVFNLKPQKQSREEKLPKKNTTPLKRTKRRLVHNESVVTENGYVNKNSGDESDSDSEVQLLSKGKRKMRHDVIVDRGDEQRVKKKFKKETHSSGHTRESAEDSLSSQTKGSNSKKAKGDGSERTEEASVKNSNSKPKASKGVFNEKELGEAFGDSDENEVDMESLDDEDDAESGEEDGRALDDSSLGPKEEGITTMGLSQSEQ